jgi:hypothetical protein
MKPNGWFAAALLGLAGGWATAQTQIPMPPDTPPPTQAPPSQAPPLQPPPAVAPAVTSPVVPVTPAPIHIETKVDMHTEPGPPADPHAAHEEAVNALHWAKTEGCRSDPSPRDCVRRAQDDYNAALARIGARR